MASKYSITALGELLIDFTEVGTSQNGQKMFERNPGGAPANVLVAARKLGATTAFIGKVGDDMHGAFLRDTLAGEGEHGEGPGKANQEAEGNSDDCEHARLGVYGAAQLSLAGAERGEQAELAGALGDGDGERVVYEGYGGADDDGGENEGERV